MFFLNNNYFSVVTVNKNLRTWYFLIHSPWHCSDWMIASIFRSIPLMVYISNKFKIRIMKLIFFIIIIMIIIIIVLVLHILLQILHLKDNTNIEECNSPWVWRGHSVVNTELKPLKIECWSKNIWGNNFENYNVLDTEKQTNCCTFVTKRE